MTVKRKHVLARPVVRKHGASLSRIARGAVATVAAFCLVGTAAASASELGVDVSKWQHTNGTSIDWASVKADGVSFAFVKATEGSTYTNPYFAGDWAATRSVGLYHGAYHFARPSVGSAGAQARYFVSKAGLADQPGDLPPVLDLEATGGLGVAALRTWTSNWLKTVESLIGRKPIIYTSPTFWENNLGNSTAFTAYPLWIAHYKVSQPRVPGGWSTWTFWQGRSDGRVTGVSGSVDMNAFNGTLAQLATLANAPVTIPAPGTPSGDTSQPGSTKTATSVSLATSRPSVYAGQNVTLSGDLTTDAGLPLAGRKAVLRSRPAGQTTWSQVAAIPTDAAGHFATTLKVSSAASYKVTVAATTKYTRAVSPVQSVSITPKTITKVSLAAGRAAIRRGARVRLFGHLTSSNGAAVSGKQVRYYVRPAGSTTWRLLGSTTSVAPSGWHQRYVKPAKTSTYKAVFAGGLRFTRARSVLVKVSVR
jgi:GH25 family lysozyme M1 (1,4-beta-N-acetylmuramidase)